MKAIDGFRSLVLERFDPHAEDLPDQAAWFYQLQREWRGRTDNTSGPISTALQAAKLAVVGRDASAFADADRALGCLYRTAKLLAQARTHRLKGSIGSAIQLEHRAENNLQSLPADWRV